MSKEIKKEEELTAIPRFNDHGNCQGHANYMLDCEYKTKKERVDIIKCISNYIK